MKNELNKLLENRIYNREECVSKIEELADELAVKFLDWCRDISRKKVEGKSSKEVLEIYKKEKELQP